MKNQNKIQTTESEVDARIKVADLLIKQSINENLQSTFSVFRSIVRYAYVYPELKVSDLLETLSSKFPDLFVNEDG